MIKNWLAKQQAKAALIQVFKSSEIGINYSYGQNNGMVYPKIRSVAFDYDKKTVKYSFSLPTGLDPKEVKKKEYCFKQVFGQHIELKGEIKEFSLTVFVSVLPSVLKYDYKSYIPYFHRKALPMVAGMNINGQLIVYDMVKNPHLLIAGETGSGKSTQLRSILTTLIQTVQPKQLELYLCDLKRSEFHLFRHIEHVRGLFNSAKEMLPMLKYLQNEMRRRGDLLDHHEVAHIDDLKEKPPYIVLCIDEVALLQKENKLMELVEEISAIGRALGVFLILSMQRPDSKVLDGKLKNNLTVRMGFKCADLINSRIIGTPGSEKLKREGRMLLKIPIFSELIEIQSLYLTLDKAKNILKTYKSIKTKEPKMTHSKPFNDVFETKENENGIFEVLDE